MHCPSLRGTSEAEGVIVNVNVIVIVIVRKRVNVIVIVKKVHVCNVMGLLLYSDNSE